MITICKRFDSNISDKPKSALPNSSDRDIQMPTPLSIGFDLTYQAASENRECRPLAIVAGWLGAKPRQLRPYLEFYHSQGIDTLSFAVGPHHIILPENGEKQMRKVLEFCKARTMPATSSIEASSSARDPRLITNSLVFHHFSVGGYLFGQMLRQWDSEFHGHLKPSPGLIKAQIFDSPPDFTGIARGVSRSMGVGAPFNKAIETLLNLYLAITSNTTVGRGHRAASAAFHENPVCAPALWFYSKSDPVADYKDCEAVIAKWRGRGTPVQQCVWDDSPHIQHGRVDPERYFGTLKKFLHESKVLN